MTPVTVDTGAKNGYYASGDIGWSARSVFAHRVAISQLVRNSQVSFGTTSTAAAFAQSFTPASSFDISTIRVGLAKAGAPTDNLTLEIRSDNANSPSSTVLATADNIHTNSSIATSEMWKDWHFSSPLSLSSGTKYWIVMARSGAHDAANYFRVSQTTTSVYAGGGSSTYNSGTGLWSSESGFNDICFQVLQETPIALYHVTQDTSLHVWKSTDDGATWSEQDSANAPTVTNANYPFDASSTSTGPYIITARMTGTNAAAVRVFNMSTDQWEAADYGTSPPSTVSNERNIRVANNNALITSSPGAITLHFTDSADDADLRYQRVTGAGNAWGASVLVLSLTSGEASMYADVVMDQATPGFLHCFYYDCVNDDFSMRSLTSTTQGTQIDLDDTAATTDTKYASATYQPYLNGSGVTTVIAAYIDADDSIQERILNLDVTSASVSMATEYNVGTATTTAGRQLSTCRYDGKNYVFAAVSGTGIVYYESTTAGTWTGPTTLISGGTNIVLSQAIAIEGHGLGVVYTDNGNATFDWVIAPDLSSDAEAITTTAILALTGHPVTATGQRNATATTTTATLELTSQSVTVTGGTGATATTTTALLELTSQPVTASAGVTATTETATFALTGQTVNAAGQRNETAVTETASLFLTSQPVHVSAGVTAITEPALLTLTGQDVTVDAATGATASTTTALLHLASQSVVASAGVQAFTAPAVLELTGQTVTATGQRNETALTSPCVLSLTSQPVAVSAGVTAAPDTAILTLDGQSVTVTGQRNETAVTETAMLSLTGFPVNLYGDGLPPTVFIRPLTATVWAEPILTSALSSEPSVTAALSGERVLSAIVSIQPILTVTLSSEPVLTARMRVNE